MEWIFLRVFSGRKKNQYDWSSEDLISSIKLGAGAPRHSPVDLGVAAGEDDRDVSVRFRVLGGTSAQKSRFSRFFFKTSEIITFQYFQNEVTEIRGEIRIWG